jgi:hypothetical protein
MAKKKRKSSNKRKAVVDLDRFAGSSEEEEQSAAESENDESSDEEEHAMAPPSQRGASIRKKSAVNDNDDKNVEDEEEELVVASGMAAAMSRILGTTTSKPGTTPVVLSKTITPLQRMAAKEQKLEKEQREKRRANRERNLTALHIPLSVATSRVATSDTGKAVAMELEQERTHRRVATRGVVALFNAIAQHQKKSTEAQTSTSGKSESKQQVKKLSKHGFLDMIKSTAAAKTANAETTTSNQAVEAVTTSKAPSNNNKGKWNALQDDYMLNSKLKDWDKESSDEEEEEGADIQADWASDEDEGAVKEAPSKKQRIKAH